MHGQIFAPRWRAVAMPRGCMRAGRARWRNAEPELNAAFARAFQATDAMPRFYHGIVRRELL